MFDPDSNSDSFNILETSFLKRKKIKNTLKIAKSDKITIILEPCKLVLQENMLAIVYFSILGQFTKLMISSTIVKIVYLIPVEYA